MHPVTESADLSRLAPVPPAGPDPVEAAPKVPDLVALYGHAMTDTTGLELSLQAATDDVLAFAYLALWWHQSGRPALVGSNAATLRHTLSHVADAALAGGVHAGCRALGTLPPAGAWWCFGPFDAPDVEQPMERITGLDTLLGRAARELSTLQRRLLALVAIDDDGAKLAALDRLVEDVATAHALAEGDDLAPALAEEAPTDALPAAAPRPPVA